MVAMINRLYNLSKWQYDLSSMYILIASIVWNQMQKMFFTDGILSSIKTWYIYFL